MRIRFNRKTGAAIGGGITAITVAAAAFIQPWEGRELRAYRDIVGVLTICDGDTQNVRPGQVATHAECDQRLWSRVREFERDVGECLTRDVPQSVEVSLVELAYNVGSRPVCTSTMMRLANAGQYRAACDQLLRWVNAGGRRVQGLVNRREASREQCLSGL